MHSFSGIKGKEWEELHYHHREMNQAAGAKKPSQSQKAKGHWRMKAAWDRGEECYDPARNKDILGRTKTRRLQHLKDPLAALAKALECSENPHEGWHLVSQFVVASLCRCNGVQHRWHEDCAKDVGRALVERRLALPGSMGRGAFTQIIQLLECPR